MSQRQRQIQAQRIEPVTIVLPWGRNAPGVFADAHRWCRERGAHVEAAVLVYRDFAEYDADPGHGALLDGDGKPVKTVAANPRNLELALANEVDDRRVVVVMNGGTTKQQWAMSTTFWDRERADATTTGAASEHAGNLGNELAATIARIEATAWIALDVQRDGVEVLDIFGVPEDGPFAR